MIHYVVDIVRGCGDLIARVPGIHASKGAAKKAAKRYRKGAVFAIRVAHDRDRCYSCGMNRATLGRYCEMIFTERVVDDEGNTEAIAFNPQDYLFSPAEDGERVSVWGRGEEEELMLLALPWGDFQRLCLEAQIRQATVVIAGGPQMTPSGLQVPPR